MCGFLSHKINVKRSARQGDPIAPYLFVIALEVLALRIRHDSRIKGYSCGSREQKLSLLADDVTCYFEGTKQEIESSLRILYDILQEFEHVSGLKTSAEKSNAMWIGAAVGQAPICLDLRFSWSSNLKLLGVTFDDQLKELDKNFDEKLIAIQKLLAGWKQRSLTLLGKITVWKTLALSKLTYIALMIPFISPERIKRIREIMLEFLWGGGSAKIAIRTLQLPTSEGGLNLPSIEEYLASLKTGWIRRFVAVDSFWKHVLRSKISENGLNPDEIFRMGDKYSESIAKKLTNPFWKEVFQSFSHWQLKVQRLNSDSKRTPIWFNSDITRGHTTLSPEEFTGWIEAGITEVGDLRDSNNAMLGFQEFCSRTGISNTSINSLLFAGVIGSVTKRKTFVPSLAKDENDERPSHTLISEIILQQTKGCRHFRKIHVLFSTHFGSPTPVKERWH